MVGVAVPGPGPKVGLTKRDPVNGVCLTLRHPARVSLPNADRPRAVNKEESNMMHVRSSWNEKINEPGLP